MTVVGLAADGQMAVEWVDHGDSLICLDLRNTFGTEDIVLQHLALQGKHYSKTENRCKNNATFVSG